MERVSDRWKELHTGDLLPESFIEITYQVTDVGVNENYEVSDNGHAPWSSTRDMSQADNVPRYATLERNLWILDGTRTIMPDNEPYGEGKFVGNVLSGSDGYFEVHPEVVLTWPEVNTGIVPGLTVQWSETYDEYPLDYTVKVYNGDTLIHSARKTDNDSVVNVFLIDIQNYDRVVIEIERWNLPYHRARMEKLYVGLINTYTKNDLMSYTHEDSVDPLSGELPKNSITFSLENVENQWNPFNPEGIGKYLLERQTLKVRYGMEVDGIVEWINGGMFFISEWSTPSNGLEATFTATDVLDFLTDPYTGTRTGTLYDIAVAAITQVLRPDDATYRFDASLLTIDVDFSAEDTEYSIAEVLQMVANAGKCIMYQDRTGCLRIEPAGSLTDYIIRLDESWSYPEITLSKELRAVDVNNGMAVIENAPTGEVQTVENPLITTAVRAAEVGAWTQGLLQGRKSMNGEYRADVRLAAGDTVTAENKFSAAGNRIIITSIKYEFTGAFRGTFEGRVIDGEDAELYGGGN